MENSRSAKAAVLKQVVSEGILNNVTTSVSVPAEVDLEEAERYAAFFFDLDAYDQNVRRMIDAFPPHFLHAAAVKANPLEWFMTHRKEMGLGAECASLGEVAQAIKSNAPMSSIIFDSPCKTAKEIRFALVKGIHLNVDNIQELSVVKEILDDLKTIGVSSESNVGLRINPLVGAGSISHLSVSTGKSKFGCPCPTADMSLKEREIRNLLVKTCAENEFLNCVHVHVGSGGMGLKKLFAGIRVAIEFVNEVNEMRKQIDANIKLIDVIDIGGGIAVNFLNESQPGLCSIEHNVFKEYAEQMRVECPELFNENVFKQVITEFGAALNMSFGWFASRVEYTKDYDGHNTALIHGGSDLFLRSAYCPENFGNHSIEVHNLESGKYLTGFPDAMLEEKNEMIELESYNIAGPLCFAGDMIARNVSLPKDSVQRGDFVVVTNCGANTIALKNMHCSRPIPGVYGYRNSNSNSNRIELTTIKSPQTLSELLAFWK